MFTPGHLHRDNSDRPEHMRRLPPFSVDFYYDVRKDPQHGPMLHMRLVGEVDGRRFEEEFELQLADAPHLEVSGGAGGGGAGAGGAGAMDGESAGAEGQSPVARRRALRDANAVLVRALAGATGMTHAQVNGELNRMSGVRRVAEADADALEKRRAAGARWLTRISMKQGAGTKP